LHITNAVPFNFIRGGGGEKAAAAPMPHFFNFIVLKFMHTTA
jgi:hypothetical protein